MARGQVLVLTTGVGQIIETASREEIQSVAILNPNDGVVYIKLNQAAGLSASQWDWKLPSQSFGLFPGPWISLGLYYVDQSGSGRNGEINVYDTSDKIYTPVINAIGRAVQTAGSNMDVSQGTIPQNPPANTGRLWVDANYNLHLLRPDGTDQLEIDSNDAAGGDLTGTYPSPSIGTGVVTNAKLQNKTIDNTKIADGTINTALLANGSVTSAKIGTPLQTGGYFQVNNSTAVPPNGAGVEMYGGGDGVVQGFDRGAGAFTQLYLRGSQVRLEPQSSTVPQLHAIGTWDQVLNNDWFRGVVNGQGIFNNVAGQGIGLSLGQVPWDYSTGRQFVRQPVANADLTAGLITYDKVTNPQGTTSLTNQTLIQSAPSGTVAGSGSFSLCPAPFNSFTIDNRRQNGFIMIEGVINVSMSGANFAVQLGIGWSGSNQITLFANTVPGTQIGIPFTVAVQSSSFGVGAIAFSLYWMVNQGTMTWRTDIYSWVRGHEIRA